MRKYARVVLIFMVALHTVSFLGGCASNPTTETGWVSVTKPPIQVIYVNRHGAVPAEVVHGIIKQVEAFPFKDYKFNDVTSISLDASSVQSSELINSSTSSATVGIGDSE